MMKYLLLLIFSLIHYTNQSTTCEIKNLVIPTEIFVGDDVTLVCEYDIGDELLYSVKWYKEKIEFYRFTPQDFPQKKNFPLEGVTVHINGSSNSKVVLKNVENQTSGMYHCEVSTDSPSFNVCTRKKYLRVKTYQSASCEVKNLVVPTEVQVGDNVTLNCEYDVGDKPIYHVKWYKGTTEFFRYTRPIANRPTRKEFPTKGVTLDINNSYPNKVVLKNVQNETSGDYSCEVFPDAPPFGTCSGKNHLRVRNIGELWATVRVPTDSKIGENVTLECNYNIGPHSLLVIKWYKGKDEFFRYLDNEEPDKMIFHHQNITVDVGQSSKSKVVLKDVELGTQDNYTCEVITGPPSFLEFSDSKYLYIDQNKENKKTSIRVNVPANIQRKGNVMLSCNYDIGNLTLFGVKWFKNMTEFFRSTPSEPIQSKLFPIPGIEVDRELSSGRRLVLKNLEDFWRGEYRCGVVTNPPEFITISGPVSLDAIIPNTEPRVVVDHDYVNLGDTIQAVCIFPISQPAPDIVWLLNENKVENSTTVRQGSKYRVLTASFVKVEIENDIFENNKANLTCEVSVGKFYKVHTTVVIEKHFSA